MSARCGESGEHGGQHARTARRRRGDDDAHGGVDFLHGQRAREDVAERRAGQRTRGTGAQLRRVAADESGRGAQVARHALRDGLAHDAERAPERVADVVDGAALIRALRLQRDRARA